MNANPKMDQCFRCRQRDEFIQIQFRSLFVFYRQSARVAPISKFTQLSSASRLSTRYWCSVGPKPDGDANCLTMAFVRSYCCCGKIGSSARKYSDIVCSSGGTGSFGKSCNENQQQKNEIQLHNWIIWIIWCVSCLKCLWISIRLNSSRTHSTTN